MPGVGEDHLTCPGCRLAPTMEWDTAAADIIVREAGGVVLQAGRCSGQTGELLEDWRVSALWGLYGGGLVCSEWGPMLCHTAMRSRRTGWRCSLLLQTWCFLTWLPAACTGCAGEGDPCSLQQGRPPQPLLCGVWHAPFLAAHS